MTSHTFFTQSTVNVINKIADKIDTMYQKKADTMKINRLVFETRHLFMNTQLDNKTTYINDIFPSIWYSEDAYKEYVSNFEVTPNNDTDGWAYQHDINLTIRKGIQNAMLSEDEKKLRHTSPTFIKETHKEFISFIKRFLNDTKYVEQPVSNTSYEHVVVDLSLKDESSPKLEKHINSLKHVLTDMLHRGIKPQIKWDIQTETLKMPNMIYDKKLTVKYTAIKRVDIILTDPEKTYDFIHSVTDSDGNINGIESVSLYNKNSIVFTFVYNNDFLNDLFNKVSPTMNTTMFKMSGRLALIIGECLDTRRRRKHMTFKQFTKLMCSKMDQLYDDRNDENINNNTHLKFTNMRMIFEYFYHDCPLYSILVPENIHSTLKSCLATYIETIHQIFMLFSIMTAYDMTEYYYSMSQRLYKKIDNELDHMTNSYYRAHESVKDTESKRLNAINDRMHIIKRLFPEDVKNITSFCDILNAYYCRYEAKTFDDLLDFIQLYEPPEISYDQILQDDCEDISDMLELKHPEQLKHIINIYVIIYESKDLMDCYQVVIDSYDERFKQYQKDTNEYYTWMIKKHGLIGGICQRNIDLITDMRRCKINLLLDILNDIIKIRSERDGLSTMNEKWNHYDTRYEQSVDRLNGCVNRIEEYLHSRFNVPCVRTFIDKVHERARTICDICKECRSVTYDNRKQENHCLFRYVLAVRSINYWLWKFSGYLHKLQDNGGYVSVKWTNFIDVT